MYVKHTLKLMFLAETVLHTVLKVMVVHVAGRTFFIHPIFICCQIQVQILSQVIYGLETTYEIRRNFSVC